MSIQDHFKRALVYYPIIHAQVELGTLGEVAQKIIETKIGQEALTARLDSINKIWFEIKQSIQKLEIDYKKTRIYQDGLPLCGRESEIVMDLAESGSVNHQIVLELQNKGAMLMGTERPDLLVEEYQLFKNALIADDSNNKTWDPAKFKAIKETLLNKRDEYIANRINTTLAIGETGILFLGLLHSIENRLDSDIHLIYPVDMRLQQI